MPENSRSDAQADRIDFEFYHRVLQRNWKVLLFGALVGAVLGLALAMTRPVLFEGVTTLMVSPPPGGADESINAATLKPLFQDLKMASEVIDELKLGGEPHNLTPQRFVADHAVIGTADARNLLELRVRLDDAALAAEASRLLADKVVAFNRRLNERRSSFERHTLKRQLDKATERLELTEQALLTVQQQAQIDLLKGDADALVEGGGDLMDFAIRIEGERARLRAAEQELKRVPRLLDVPATHDLLPPVGRATSEGTVAREDVRRNFEDKRVAGQRPKLDSRDWDRVHSDRIAQPVPDQRGSLLNPVYQALEAEIATSRLRLAGLKRQHREIAEARKAGGDASAKLNLYYQRRLQLARLEADYQVAARVRNELLLKYEQAAASAMTSSPQLHLVNEALAADRPLSRRRVESSTIGLAIGLLAAGLLVVVRATGRRP